MRHIHLCGLLLLCGVVFTSCHDADKFTDSPSARLNFSTDTVKFDTVFTTIGSVTKQFRVYNRNKEAVRTSVSIADNGYYRLNIDGVAANNYVNLEIRGNDSAYIFVEVTIDPQNSNSPVIVLDSIQFNTNGNLQDVKLMAFGQDVHFYNDSIIGNTHWVNDKPYLIYNSVKVDSLCTLDIDAGVHLYFHNNSSLIVAGQIHVNGTKDEPVVFQGDRFEEYYKDKPGLWGATYTIDDNTYYYGNIHLLSGSSGNTIDYAIIRNGTKGVQIDNHVDGETTLTISNTVISEMSIAGVYARSANVDVFNTLIYNCDYYAAALTSGGNYNFVHTTLVNYAARHNMPSLMLRKSGAGDNDINVNDLKAHFANSIIHGSLNSELIIDEGGEGDTKFEFKFENCMLKVAPSFEMDDTAMFKNIVSGADELPRFVNAADGDYHLDTLSSAKDRGTAAYLVGFPLDLDGVERDSLPDLGAYERVEQ
ncbi:MAG: right-handed parallel beta-helix repeat-containing protein [Salinivirgaceae bacterium]|nr:right-handed parallel beta-helix repeat-containing protein [Salinivirgaceae bacterium]